MRSAEPRPGALVGGCVCGHVRFEATSEPLRITICHCVWCQRRTGSAFGVEVVFDARDLSVDGDSLRRHVVRSDESGRWIEQTFCADCGSNIGLTLEAAPGIRSLAAGLFDDPAALRNGGYPVRHAFTRSAQPWVTIPADAEQFERYFR